MYYITFIYFRNIPDLDGDVSLKKLKLERLLKAVCLVTSHLFQRKESPSLIPPDYSFAYGKSWQFRKFKNSTWMSKSFILWILRSSPPFPRRRMRSRLWTSSRTVLTLSTTKRFFFVHMICISIYLDKM